MAAAVISSDRNPDARTRASPTKNKNGRQKLTGVSKASGRKYEHKPVIKSVPPRATPVMTLKGRNDTILVGWWKVCIVYSTENEPDRLTCATQEKQRRREKFDHYHENWKSSRQAWRNRLIGQNKVSDRSDCDVEVRSGSYTLRARCIQSKRMGNESD